jgi:alpha-glucosidase
MSPIFRSPMHDFGYDVSDYRDIAPEFGTLDDIDELIGEARRRGIAVLLDMILPHTSIEHAWFRDRPNFYIWSDSPANNWPSQFGGSAWHLDPASGRHYYHRFYPEQPDLNWRNPEVRDAMYDVMRFWIDRGVHGFRLDALDGLYKREDLADMPPRVTPFPLPFLSEVRNLEHTGYESNLPETFEELARLRATFPDAWFVGEAFRPIEDLAAYTRHLDVAFNFEFLFCPFDVEAVGEVLRRSPSTGLAWTLSNHDFSRLVTRAGRDLAKVAAALILTLPGATFIYQGDELGMIDGPGSRDEPYDRVGRDAFRHPMQWAPDGGFTTGTPWLPMTDPETCNAATQDDDPSSMLNLYRRLIHLRRRLRGDLEVVHAQDALLAYKHGDYLIACNLGRETAEWPCGDVLLHTAEGASNGILPPRSAFIAQPIA